MVRKQAPPGRDFNLPKPTRSSLEVTRPSTGCGVTWRWFSPCWRYFYKPQLSGKSLHFCAFSSVFLRVSVGEWILLEFQAGLHWFLTGMNTTTPCWLHHCIMGAFFCYLRLYSTRLVELDINCLLTDVNHAAPKTVKIAYHGLHPAGASVFPFRCKPSHCETHCSLSCPDALAPCQVCWHGDQRRSLTTAFNPLVSVAALWAR